MLPTTLVSDQPHCAAHPVRAWIDSEITQQLECWQRGGPGLARVLVAPPPLRRKARASRPLAVFALQREQSGTPALDGHPRALRRDHLTAIAIALSLFAALMQSMTTATLVQFAIGGIAGVVLRWVGWPRAPFLLGFVLGPIAEISYIQTSQIWGWGMFLRPLAIIMLAGFGFSIARALLNRSPSAKTALGGPDALLATVSFTIFAVAMMMTIHLPDGASPAPLIVTAVAPVRFVPERVAATVAP